MDKEFWIEDQKFRERQKREQEISANEARTRIVKKAQISIQTCAIGALSDMEDALGFLWRHGEKYEKLSLEEKKIRDRWNEIRDSILDRSENSKRLLLKEIERTEFKGYNPKRFTTIIRKKNNGARDER